jgi:hypothetical protein
MIDALAARILLASSPVLDCLRADSPSKQRSRVSRDVISNATEFCPRTVRGTSTCYSDLRSLRPLQPSFLRRVT